MKKLIPALLLFASCGGPSSKPATATPETVDIPPAGTIVAADSVAYTDDPLNRYFFTVKLRVGAGNADAGNTGLMYDILAGYGPAKAEGHMTMPRGSRGLKPLLARDTPEKYGFIIGFKAGPEYGGDGSFLPYYSVSAVRGEIRIRQVSDYAFGGR